MEFLLVAKMRTAGLEGSDDKIFRLNKNKPDLMEGFLFVKTL